MVTASCAPVMVCVMLWGHGTTSTTEGKMMKALKVGSLIRMHYSRNYTNAGVKGTHTYDILARVTHVDAEFFSYDVEAHENVKDAPPFASYPLTGTALVAVLPRRVASGEWEIES